MAKTIIGKVGITPQGEWSASRADYNRLDEVTYLGSTYRVIWKTSNVPAGTLPTNTVYFEVSARGVDVSALQYKGTFDSVELAIAGVPLANRRLGDKVSIKSGNSVVEWWWNGGVADGNLVKVPSGVKFPWQTDATFSGVADGIKNAIIDIEIIGGDKAWKVIPYTIERGSATNGHYVRLAVVDQNDALVTSINGNGIIARWVFASYTEPTAVDGRKIDILDFPDLYGGVTSVRMVIDWTLILSGNGNKGIQSYKIGGFDSKIFRNAKASQTVAPSEVFQSIPKAEEKVWAKTNVFKLGNIQNAILDVKVYGVTDKSKRYGIESLRYDPTGTRLFISVCEFSATGVKGARVAIWDVSAYTVPVLTNGKRIDTVTLSQSNSSGISATVKIDWEQIPKAGTGWNAGGYWYLNTFAVTDGEFSSNSFTDGVSKVSGSIDLTYSLNGVPARIVTSNGYTPNGIPDTLMIICHGNGQTITSAAPSLAAQAFFKANRISWTVIQAQDQTAAPFTTRASGWGNDITLQRNIENYNHLMGNYNFHKPVIVACASMGGLTGGHFAHGQPFPIRFILGIGPVPSLKLIFTVGGTVSRKQPIRNAYGLAIDGSQDAQLDAIFQSYDYYYKGLIEITGVKYKHFPPHFYAIWGTGDTTFTNDFGGTVFCKGLVDNINRAGGYATYGEKAGVSHADPTIYDDHIANGVFLKEMGIAIP